MFRVLHTRELAGNRAGGVLLCAILLLAATPADAENREQQLEQLRARIGRLQTELNETQGRRDAVREEVRGLERRIHESARTLRALDARLKAARQQHDRLRERAANERRELGHQMTALERQLRAAHAMGNEEPLKLLLNQDEPARMTRVLTYYRLLNQARTERVTAIRASLARLQGLEQRLQAQTQELEATRAQQRREQESFEQARGRRTELLASLNLQVRDRSQEIGRLRADEKRLERLVEELKAALPALAPPAAGERFANLKGRLPLPVNGRLLARYGDDKGVGSLKWRGALLTAREGQEVRAVHRGRVAYADWLRGFGLLLILEHGDGYMTLYGHNQSLYREVGEWVDGGQVIAAAGNTGDTPQAGVYFEIRHDGEPVDPLRWCKAPGRTQAGVRKPRR
ncbi:MAG: peptidase M23 [Gammaproteobacteria bacterium]|nr:MAG: peptidase M23 [Gammaproteobacteria bacterium]